MQSLTRNPRKQKEGVVTSNKMKKTVTVVVSQKIRHPRFGKIIERRSKYYAHDESDEIQVGQTVKIMETRPLSKTKRWTVVEVQGSQEVVS